MRRIALKNGRATVTFAETAKGTWRPEWFRLSTRPMLRFNDHEFLKISALRVTGGALLSRSKRALVFGGRETLAGAVVEWGVRIALPPDGGSGFVVTTFLAPQDEAVELMEGLSAFELPYEYDGTEHQTTVMSQQPVYRSEGDRDLTGAGYTHPFWYYGRPGGAHLTYPTDAPVMCSRVAGADGSNARCTTLIGNWGVCSVHDLFAQPTRALQDKPEETPFPDPQLALAPGRRGRKFLVGCVNWNSSLHKDPNVLADVGTGLQQEVLVDFAGDFPGGAWDAWLAGAWERMCRMHFPVDGRVGAWQVARKQGASWVGATEWLTAQFQKPAGCPGFFNPERGTTVYSPFTRPKWDGGVEVFCAQWVGPVAYVGHVWNDAAMVQSTERLEEIFRRDTSHTPEQIWTIGPTPFYVALMRKAQLMGVAPETLAKVEAWVRRRTEVVLDPPPGGKRGDGGILAWDAFANLLAADLFDGPGREAAALELLARVRQQFAQRFESFNCAAMGDLVGAGQGRPFGHGIAMTANVLAWRRWGKPEYLEDAVRFGNIMMGLYYAGYNRSPTPDLDTRGWAVGANGGRDQLCNLPPWETGHALQQLAHLINAGKARDGFYDLLWLFAHTGLCQFPKARTHKRLYTPDFQPVYLPIKSLATEREFYLKLPYLAYEEPWDQTMLAGYQGVEPLILSLYLGGGLVEAEDERVLALVPQAATFDADVQKRFTVHLWNPLAKPVRTRLIATVAVKQGCAWHAGKPVAEELTPRRPTTRLIEVPPRQVLRVVFQQA